MRIVMTTQSTNAVWDTSLNLAAGLQARGHQVLLAHQGPAPHRHQLAMLRQHSLPMQQGGFALEWSPEARQQAPAARRWLQSVAERFGADLIQCHAFTHISDDAVAPQVLVAHGTPHGRWQATGRLLALDDWVDDEVHRALDAADAVVVPSHAVLEELQRWYGASGTVIHPALPPVKVDAKPRASIVVCSGDPTSAEDGHATLDEAMQGIAWPGVVTNPVPEQRRPVPFRRLQTLGLLPSSEYGALLGSAALFANPAGYEPFGLGALRAGSLGCALVLADIPTNHEVWGEAAAYAAAGDASAWHDVLQAIIDDEAYREHLAAEAVERAKAFQPARCVAQYEEVYDVERLVVV